MKSYAIPRIHSITHIGLMMLRRNNFYNALEAKETIDILVQWKEHIIRAQIGDSECFLSDIPYEDPFTKVNRGKAVTLQFH